MELPDQQVGAPGIERRRSQCWSSSAGLMLIRGYVALAVSTDRGTYTREVETGLGGDREKNMVAFAAEALKLLRDVMRGNAKL